MKIPKAFVNEPHRKVFDAGQFAFPGVENAVLYTWVWNAPIDRQGICERLDEMQRMGIRALYILPEPKSFRPTIMPTMMEPDYLTPPYFELFAFAMEEAERRGMRTWLYDEGGWPSGGACGRILMENPHLAKQCLVSRRISVKAGTSYAPAADVLAAFDEGDAPVYCSDGSTLSKVVFEKDCTLREYTVHRQFFDAPGLPDYPDLLLRESCEAFLASTHEKYAPYLKNQFGKNMTAVFTDEAKAPGSVPFSKGMRERFERTYGYSVLPLLPALDKWKRPEAPPLSKSSARAAADWYELAARMLCENWMAPQKAWCNRHNMCFTGHMDRDDEPAAGLPGCSFHLLRALRYLDIPGVDVIWRQLWPGKPVAAQEVGTLSNGFFPRYASSAAAQNGSPYAVTETAAIYGVGLAPEKLRWLLGYQAVRGINRFNLMSVFYGNDGWLMAGAQPSFREHNACYADLAPFNMWAQRLAWVASVGRRAADIALYQPVRDIWSGDTEVTKAFDAAGRSLDACGAEFDIFDDDVLESADPDALKNGEIHLGLARYRTLILPEGATFQMESERVLRRFMAGGGNVYCTGRTCALQGVKYIGRIEDVFSHALPVSGGDGSIRVSRRVLTDGEIYMVFNEKDTFVRCEVTLPEGSRRLWPEDGRITKCSEEKLSLGLQSGETAVFLCGECAKKTAASDEPVYENSIPVGGEWTIRPVKQLHLGEMHVETRYPEALSQPTVPGDWRANVGEGFSGSCEYETAFSLEKVPDAAALDLGEVKYTCEAWLNGVPLGMRVMPPYLYTLKKGVLQKDNVLKVRVTNTAANEYAYSDTFSKWQPWQRADHYFQKEMEFDRDSFESGLYGPVRLLY